VFSPPARETLKATSFPMALALNREILGAGISKQTYCIMPKIRQVDDLMTRRQRHVREVHPEVCFASLSDGRPMTENKRTRSGQTERIAVLRRRGLNVSAARLAEERERVGLGNVAPDDLTDALVCLVTAPHIRTGHARSLGDPEQRDAKGLLMEIAAPL
jgi:predicted RNase H-like nuclease